MSATGKKGEKRPRTLDRKTVDFKYQALLKVEKGVKSQREIAKELNIKTNTLSTWVRDDEKVKAGFLNYGLKRKVMKTGRWNELETALLKFFKNARDQGALITGAILMQKADVFAQKLEISDFQAKPGWLTRFKERYNIVFKNVCGESKSVEDNSEVMIEWESKLSVLLQKYKHDGIYNADETGIFYKLLPDKTLEFKTVDCHGGKRSKERLSVLVCANMSGTDKLPLLVIGKAEKPRCFKNGKTLPTKYTNNKKAWMTCDKFEEWPKEVEEATEENRHDCR